MASRDLDEGIRSEFAPPRGARHPSLRVCGGVLIAVLKLTEYRFLVVEPSVEIYVALVAALFAGLGIWLGLTLTRKSRG